LILALEGKHYITPQRAHGIARLSAVAATNAADLQHAGRQPAQHCWLLSIASSQALPRRCVVASREK